MYIKKLLNQKAKELMAGTPQNVQKQTDAFVSEVSKAVNSYLAEADKKVEAAEARVPTPSGTGEGEKYFTRIQKVNALGQYLAIFRASLPTKPLICMHYQNAQGSPRFCTASCAGFQILDSGNVMLCDGHERNIVKENNHG